MLSLKNQRLQEVIQAIDSVEGLEQRHSALAQVLQSDPHFAEFVNAMLQKVGVRDERGQCLL